MNKHWQMVALGEFLTERQEIPLTDDLITGKIAVIEKIAFSDGKIQLRTTSDTKTNMILIRQGDLVLSGINAEKGAVAIYENKEPIAATIHYGSYISNKDKVDIKFLWYFFRSHVFKNLLTQYLPNGIKTELKAKRLLPLPVPIPSLLEQRHIVARIEALAAKIEEVKRLRQEITTDLEHLLAAMAHRNDLSNDEKTKEGWIKLKLKDILSQTKNSETVKSTETYRSIGIYSFGKGCFKRTPIFGSEIKSKTLYKVSSGQFIYARLNAYEGSFALVTNEFDGCYVSNEFPTFDCNPNYVLPEFLIAYFNTPHIWQELRHKITGIGGDSGNRRIRLREKDFLSLQIVLPPLSWQHKIKDIHNQQKNISPLQNKVMDELNALMPAILDKAFKGNL